MAIYVFLTKATTLLAVAFFVTSLGLAYFATERSIASQSAGVPMIESEAGEIPMPEGLLPTISDQEVPVIDDSADSEVPNG